jgi:signal transduction histidine kinase
LIPHGHCYLWQPNLVLLQVSSNLLIGLAYVVISSTLAYLVWRVRDIPFQRMYMAFGIFIVSCGITHLMDVWTVWTPVYWLDGWIRAVTAAASVLTAVLLPPLVPQAVALAQAARTAHDRGIVLATAYEDLDNLYQRQRDLDRSKTLFFANVSHELRTPLALIIGPVDKLLASGALSPAQQQDLALVRRNAEMLLANVNDLLDLARSEAGRLQVHPEATDLAAVVRGVAAHYADAAARNGIALTLDVPDSLPITLDAGQMERVLLNLLSNAFKFVSGGGVVRVALTPEATRNGEPGTVLLSVADSGPGVPVAERERIFERFYQGENAQTRRLGGTGLGLAIVRDLVTLHHGTVAVADAPEGGAVFLVRLPWVQPAAGAPLQSTTGGGTAWQVRQEIAQLGTRQPVRDDGNGRSGRVLIVEDNVEMNDFLAQALQGEFAVDQAFDGQEGMRLGLERYHDLILTDLMMPGLSGEQMIGELRRHREIDAVPILVLTAKADEDTRVQLLREGAQDFLIKPFNNEELKVRVRRAITIKRARDLLQRELSSQIVDMEQLAQEVTVRRDELEQALAMMKAARDEAERANLAKSTFLNLVSHELRTPLTTLKLHLHLLQRDPQLTPAQLDRLRRMTTALDRLLHLVETVLTYTRLQSGRLVTAVEPVDLGLLAEGIGRDLKDQADQKGIALVVESPLQAVTADSDAALLRIMLTNLVENAIKYTQQGTVQVAVTPESTSLTVTVRDSGPGIPPDDLARVFEPFEQVATIRRKTVPGVGLGLTIVRDIVAALGGTIRVDSQVGEGTTFAVSLPLQAPPPATAAA